MPNPKISVIMIVKNNQEFLNPAIDSVLRQTYKNIELIICDNGSEDNSASIIKFYGDSRVKYFKQKPVSYDDALLNVLQHAEGDFIALMGADDVIYPDRLKKQSELLIKFKDIDVVASNFFTIDKDGLPKSVYKNLTTPHQLQLQMLLGLPVEAKTFMFRQSVAVTLRKMIDFPIMERPFYWQLNNGYIMANIPELLYAKRELTNTSKDPTKNLSSNDKKTWFLASKIVNRKNIKAELMNYIDKDRELAKPYLALLAKAVKTSANHRKPILSASILLSVFPVQGFRRIFKLFLENSAARLPYEDFSHAAAEEDFS